MATKNGFSPEHSLPLFLCDNQPEILCDDEPEEGIGNGRAVISIREHGIGNDGSVISLRFVIASVLVATATAAGVSILSAGNRVPLVAEVTASVAEVTASLADKSSPQPGAEQATPIVQSVLVQSAADAEALPPTAQDVPTREINAPEAASPTKKETEEASTEALFKEFQAWNAEQDARDLAKPVQDDPAPAAKNATASVRPVQKHRRAQAIRNARAEMIRDARERRRANVRRQNERAQARSIQDARAQAQYVQYAQPPVENAQQPSFLESLNPFGTNWLQH
jgi:hypothetical protein